MSLETLVSDNIAAIVGVLGAIFGGAGVKAIERFFAKGDRKLDDAAKIRQELWGELATLRQEIKDVRDELDEWKEKYFKLYAENAELLRLNSRKDGEIVRLNAICAGCPYKAEIEGRF